MQALAIAVLALETEWSFLDTLPAYFSATIAEWKAAQEC
jgi:hypothetical protein